MKLSTTLVHGVTVAELEGSLDTNTSGDAEEALVRVLDRGATRLLLDFEKVDFVASSGLRILLVIGKRMKADGGALRICSLNETVNEVFEISGFNMILNVDATRDEALKGFEGS